TSPIFGVFWFTSRVDTDRDSGMTMLRDIVVTNTRWPDSEKGKEEQVSMYLTSLMPKTGIPMSLERLRASLATVDLDRNSVEGSTLDSPKIIGLQETTERVSYAGEPRTIAIANTELERVVNTAHAVVKDKKSDTYYLSGGKLWYSAKAPKGPWSSIDK